MPANTLSPPSPIFYTIFAFAIQSLTTLVDAAPKGSGTSGGGGRGGSSGKSSSKGTYGGGGGGSSGDGRKTKLKPGVIVGIVLGAIAFILLLYLAFFLYQRRRRSNQQKKIADKEGSIHS
ncbi:unnamed protein product [Clonostachys solani]|uniref:Transmembrane protein n=1 Tax=Clonostachys solani TaxID=160281 RepID=A0A9N9ZEW1_9HYPO|nr:unnamed protein product [Clonostachys solani]